MSDLFRSALGGLFSGGGVSAAGSGSGGVYTSTSGGGVGDESGAVGLIIPFSATRNVRLLRLIAEGGFSYVYQGVELQSGESVAVKKIIATDPDAKQAVGMEKDFLSQFQHQHIAAFLGHWVKGGGGGGRIEEHYLALEFCPVPLPTPPLRLQYTTQVFAQTCRAIKYLHDFGIVHRDIKLENVLIGRDGLVKLVDFGSATMEKYYPTPDWSMNKRTLVEEAIAAKTTPMYRAPEMLDLWSNYPIDEHVDMWALGCLLFALNFGQHPFQDSNKLAIVNANYSLPKNISDSGPVVTVIRGLLKVNPGERFSFGQILEVLASIAESQNFALNAPLPFKAPVSPQTTGTGLGTGVGLGIVNPLASSGTAPGSGPPPTASSHQQHSSGGGSGSLFSSLKGGAASLIKNIKEQSQAYLGPGVGPSSVPVTSSNGSASVGHHHVPPPRPAPPPVAGAHPSRPPPPRPPPSPLMARKVAGEGEQLEFENREYEAMNTNSVPGRPPPPRPAAPPSPRHCLEEVQQATAPKIANLLDMSFDSGPSLEPPAQLPTSSSNADLLDDLFGGSAPTGNSNLGSEDLFWGGTSIPAPTINPTTTTTNKPSSDVGDLLGDPLASLLGKSAPTNSSMPRQGGGGGGFAANFGPSPSQQPFLQPNTSPMPQSASFQNLSNASTNLGGGNLIDSGFGPIPTAGKIPKNSSSPNLLSDLILGDIISSSGGPGTLNSINISATAGSSGGGGSSNPTLSQQQPPNYNRTAIFDPPAASQPKQNLNDVFGDILTSQGFAASNRMDGGRTINEMRKIEILSNPNANPTQIKVNDWRDGKKKNIRALLSSLHTITWDGCHWEETNMSQMITPAQVKKVYRKACLAIHPDKQMGEEWEELAKLIFVELNEAWAAFEDSQP